MNNKTANTGVWVKAIDRLPEINGDIIWREIGTSNTGGMCFKEVFGFISAFGYYRKDYENIEWLDESLNPSPSIGGLSLKECKGVVAKDNGYRGWEEMYVVEDMKGKDVYDQVCELYASQPVLEAVEFAEWIDEKFISIKKGVWMEDDVRDGIEHTTNQIYELFKSNHGK